MLRVLLGAFFLSLFSSLTTPVTDPDFWWHLASGAWMSEHGALLTGEPFTFTALRFPPDIPGRFPFTQYWLADVMFHGVHAALGLAGVVLLRASVFTLLFVLLYRLLREEGAGQLAALLLVGLAVRFVVRETGYVGDRPQMWSSLLFVGLLLCLRAGRESPRALAVLPALMLLWANLHGGFILGLVVIGLAVAEALLQGRATRPFLAASAAGFLAAGCNPTGFRALVSYPAFRLFSGEPLKGIIEETSPVALWGGIGPLARLHPALTALVLFALVLLGLQARRILAQRPALAVLFLLTAAMGLTSMRFVIFFGLVAAQLAAWGHPSLVETARRLIPYLSRPHRTMRAAVTAAALVLLTAHYATAAARTSALRPGAVPRHPYQGVADFLVGSGLEGNVLNEFGAGGYLVWRLAPKIKVFIYGRLFSGELLKTYTDVLWRPSLPGEGSLPLYRELLDSLRIDIVALPTCSEATGAVLPLALMVANDERWALVYSDPTAVVLARPRPGAGGVVPATLPRYALYDNLRAIALRARAAGSHHETLLPLWRKSLALASYLQGEPAAALALLEEYLRIVPGDADAAMMRDEIVRELGAASPPGLAAGEDKARQASGSPPRR